MVFGRRSDPQGTGYREGEKELFLFSNAVSPQRGRKGARRESDRLEEVVRQASRLSNRKV